MKDERSHWMGRWKGRTVACIASGPSLTEEDCETVRAAGVPTIVTNTTFRLCPWADVLFAFDGRWWAQYREEVDRTFHGERWTVSPLGKSHGARSVHNCTWFRHHGNSGTAAIALAHAAGAKRIVMLGYDCKFKDGRAHWHADHPKMSNAASLHRWPYQFGVLAKHVKGTEVVNSSRETALTCFQRMPLEQALQ